MNLAMMYRDQRSKTSSSMMLRGDNDDDDDDSLTKEKRNNKENYKELRTLFYAFHSWSDFLFFFSPVEGGGR